MIKLYKKIKYKTISYVKNFNPKSLIIPVFLAVSVNLIFSASISFSKATSDLKNESYNNNYQATKVVAIQKQETAFDIFEKANKNLHSSNNYTITSNGEIKSIVTQKIKLTKKFNGTTHLIESVTSGFKDIAFRAYFDTTKSDKLIKIQRGSNIVKGTAKWSDKTADMTYNNYNKRYGMTPNQVMPYLINSLSVTSTTQAIKTDEGYNFEMELHPTLSTATYGQTIKNTLKLKKLPEFQNIKLRVLIDDNYNFRNITVEENYKVVAFGIPATCKSTQNISFDFLSKVEIPNI